MDFLKAVATNTHPGILFKGIVLEAERADIKNHIPNDGVDILSEPMWWSLPDGRVVCWSVVDLAQKRDDELFSEDVHEAYVAIAKEVGYDILGKPVCDKEFELFRQDVGVLEERRWAQLEWDSPVDEGLTPTIATPRAYLHKATSARIPSIPSMRRLPEQLLPARLLWWESEGCPCWFVANAASPDKTVAVKLVCRSLLALKDGAATGPRCIY